MSSLTATQGSVKGGFKQSRLFLGLLLKDYENNFGSKGKAEAGKNPAETAANLSDLHSFKGIDKPNDKAISNFDNFILENLKEEIKDPQQIEECLTVAERAQDAIRYLALITTLKRKSILIANYLSNKFGEFSKVTNLKDLLSALEHEAKDFKPNRDDHKLKEKIQALVQKSLSKEAKEGEIDIREFARRFAQLLAFQRAIKMVEVKYNAHKDQIKKLDFLKEPFRVIHDIEEKALNKANTLKNFRVNLPQEDEFKTEPVLIFVGRAPVNPENFYYSPIHLSHSNVSRSHAFISISETGIIEIIDIGTWQRQHEQIGSTNGTFINGERIPAWQFKIALPEDDIHVSPHVLLRLRDHNQVIEDAKERRAEENDAFSTRRGVYTITYTEKIEPNTEKSLRISQEALKAQELLTDKEHAWISFANSLN